MIWAAALNGAAVLFICILSSGVFILLKFFSICRLIGIFMKLNSSIWLVIRAFIALISLSLITSVASAIEPGFKVTGEVAVEIREPIVDLVSSDGDRKEIASGEIVDGKFHLSGSVDRPIMAILRVGGVYVVEVILENMPYQVSWDEVGPFVDGGDLHEKVFGYRKNPEYISAVKNSQEVDKKVFSNLDMMDKESVINARKLSRDADIKRISIRNDYNNQILSSKESPLVKLFVLINHYDWERYDISKRMAMLDEFDEKLPDNPLVGQYRDRLVAIEEEIKSRESVSVGKPYKDVLARNEEGENITLSSVIGKNKLVLLDFWASWCGPCRGEFPHLKKAYEKYRDQGFEIYAVSIDEDREDWLAATDEEQVPWINLLVDGGWENSAVKDYAVRGVPANFLIDSEGVIRHVDLREWKLDEVLEEVFKK